MGVEQEPSANLTAEQCEALAAALFEDAAKPIRTDAAALVSSTGTSALVDIRRRRICTNVNAGRPDLFALAGRVSSQNREGREAGRKLDVRGHQLIPLPFELFSGFLSGLSELANRAVSSMCFAGL
jgi:hypothetical protein